MDTSVDYSFVSGLVIPDLRYVGRRSKIVIPIVSIMFRYYCGVNAVSLAVDVRQFGGWWMLVF